MTIIPILLGFFVASAFSLVNITVDDQDSTSTTYEPEGAWVQSGTNDLDIAGSHMFTTNSKAVAIFTFTGVAVYYMSPLWPFNVSSDLSLDNAPPIRVDLRDYSQSLAPPGSPETVLSHVVASFKDLPNHEHTLRISVHQGESLAIVDGFIYTSIEENEIAVRETPKERSHHLGTALAIITTMFALLLLFNICYCCCRGKTSRVPKNTTTNLASPSLPLDSIPEEALLAEEPPSDSLSASELGLSKPTPGVVPESRAKKPRSSGKLSKHAPGPNDISSTSEVEPAPGVITESKAKGRPKRHSSGKLSKIAPGAADGAPSSLRLASSTPALTSVPLDGSTPSPTNRVPGVLNTAEVRDTSGSAWNEGYSQPLKFQPIT